MVNASVSRWSRLAVIVALTATGLPPVAAVAENSAQFGPGYQVHFNVLTTDVLTPQVAKHYGIARSPNRGLLNVTVLKDKPGTPGQPVEATIRATATNLNDQLRVLDVREVKEGEAVYYLADFRVTDQETLNFTVEGTPAGEDKVRTVRFQHQFFTR